MENVYEILQAIKECKKLYVPFHIALQIIGTIERIEMKAKEKDDGRFQASLRNHDET